MPTIRVEPETRESLVLLVLPGVADFDLLATGDAAIPMPGGHAAAVKIVEREGTTYTPEVRP
jgi:hypothetical protein